MIDHLLEVRWPEEFASSFLFDAVRAANMMIIRAIKFQIISHYFFGTYMRLCELKIIPLTVFWTSARYLKSTRSNAWIEGT